MAHQSNESPAWGALKSACGSAEEVGELLGLIESGEDVWGDLIAEVLHQGSLYSATAPAISVAIGLLNRGPCPSARRRPAGVRDVARSQARGPGPSFSWLGQPPPPPKQRKELGSPPTF